MFFLQHLLAVYGLSWLIVNSKILETPVDWLMQSSTFLEELLSCIVCTSFWVSLFFALFVFGFSTFTLLYTFSGVGFTIIVATLIKDLD